MKKYLRISVILLIISHEVSSQTTFQKTYGTSAFESGMSIRQTFDGGFIIIANQVDTNNNYPSSLFLIKTNSQGDTLWTKKFNWPYVYARAIIQTSDSGYAITGSYGSNTLLFKTDANGDSIWLQSYPAPYPANGNALVQTYTNRYIIAGEYDILTSVCCGAFVLRTDSAGNLLSGINLGNGRAYDVHLSGDSNYVVSYSIINSSPPVPHLIKYNSVTGAPLWDRTYPLYSEMRFACTNDNSYILIGNNYNPPFGEAIIKTDTVGYFQWQKNFPAQVYFSSIVPSPGGGYYITGGKNTPSDLMLFKIDDVGDSLWTRFYGDTAEDAGIQIINTNDSGFAIIGYTYSYGAGGRDVYFIKTDSNGTASIKDRFLIQSELKIFPNPANNNFMIQFSSQKNATSKIELLNVLGEKVFEKEVDLVSGENKISINLDVDCGIYFLKAGLDDRILSQKLLIGK